MPGLDKDILGQALFDFRNHFNDRDVDDLLEEYGTIEAVRLAYAKGEAEVIINHFKANAKLSVPGAGLMAGSTFVTGTAETGTIS